MKDQLTRRLRRPTRREVASLKATQSELNGEFLVDEALGHPSVGPGGEVKGVRRPRREGGRGRER